jgi:hypothetical protein
LPSDRHLAAACGVIIWIGRQTVDEFMAFHRDVYPRYVQAWALLAA